MQSELPNQISYSDIREKMETLGIKKNRDDSFRMFEIVKQLPK
jgi:hypothetical protein